LIQTGSNTLRSEIHHLTNPVRGKKEMPQQWKECIIILTYKKGDKTDRSSYRGVSLLPTTYKISSIILLSRLTPYVDKIIGDHQSLFLCIRSTNDQIFCIHQMLEKKCKYNKAVHQLFIDVKKEVLYNILIGFDIPMKLIGK
jgi:hypothetical protein